MTDVPFNFLVTAESEQRLQELCRKDPDRDWAQFNEGMYCWSLLTYLILKQHGLPVTCSRHCRPDHINLGHAVYLSTMNPQSASFLVSLQADYPRHGWAQAHIVQNKLQRRKDSYWIPMWPQPGMIERNPSRREVQCVAFAGRHYYLSGGENAWQVDIAKLGLSFHMLDPQNWNDYSGVDVLVAIRSFDGRTYPAKPPSKLVNAWLAGIPLVAGNDSAYAQIGRPGIDYIRVGTKQEALDAIRRLQTDQAFYQRIVEAGRERAAEFTRGQCSEKWKELLSGPLTDRYDAWRSRSHMDSFLWSGRAAWGLTVRALRYSASRTFKRWIPFP
jgi:hypothetical protein